ncbi:MAG: SDR family oxidoreductase [Planctomycetes bacterium]|nr:SDR family oxidoreductase [Planctomycetota bacterium]
MNGKKMALFLAGSWVAYQAFRWARQYDLRDKSVLITGSSRGLGLVLARQFAREGARLTICARDPRELDRAREDLAGYGVPVLAVPCDVADNVQVRLLVEEVRKEYGQVDVLVNNAGTIGVGPVELMTLDDFEEAMKINFWSALYATLAVLPGMRQRKEGRIVNITSIGGKIAVPHLLPYDASKFALVGLSEGMRAELAKDGIVVTTVVPGLMRTGSPRNALFKGQHQAEFAWFNISAALPGISTSAEHAARRIVAACRRGDAEIVLTLPAQLGVALHGLFPGLTADILSVVNRLLPGPGGIYTERAKGKESVSELSPGWLTTLSDQAALENNEVAPEEAPGPANPA